MMLNRADRRATAKLLRSKATIGTKQNANTRWLASQGHSDVLIQMSVDAIREHGMPPTDADIAAAHEAGHVIVGLAMGGRFGEAYIVPNQGRWEGYSSVNIPGVNSVENCNALTDPRRGWLLGLQRAGGIHGEIIIGRYHPASSIDEAFVMTSLVHGLSRLYGVPIEVVGTTLTIVTTHIIKANRNAFEVVRSTLLTKRVLTLSEVKDLPIAQFDHDALIPGWLVKPKTLSNKTTADESTVLGATI